MPANHHRLSILSASEIDDLYGIPRFTGADRSLYFDLSGPELAAVTVIGPPVRFVRKPATSTKSYTGRVVRVGIASGFRSVG